MSKVATKLATRSAKDMFGRYAQKFVAENPEYRAITLDYWIPHGKILDKDGNVYRDYRKFKKILAAINKEIGERLIAGFAYDLGNGLGDLFAVRFQRSPGSKKMDMLASMQLKKKLEAAGTLTKTNWLVPYTDDDFVGIEWYRNTGNGQVRNIHLYNFKSAGGAKGKKSFKSRFSKAHVLDPLLKARYPYFPAKYE